MTRVTHVPVRLCMGCGGRSPQRELLRVGATPDGRLRVRTACGQPGRSGYLHRQATCWDRFAARQGLVRSLGRALDKAARAALVQELKHVAQIAIR